MDFFGAQDEARKQTRLLVGAFAITVVSIVLLIYVAISLLLMQSSEEVIIPLWSASRFLVIAGMVSLVILGASLTKMSEYRTGGGTVARSLGGRLLHTGTDNLEEQRLLNVVEEMSLASGVPVPEVYLLEGEMGINAFAAGFGTDDAAVAVTRGCLYGLSRDELQGVIAHEFSHILNGDMRMNLKMAGWIYGLFFLSIIGLGVLRTLSFSSHRRGKDKGGGIAFILAIALVLMVCGFIGQMCGRLVQAAVSRKREFLADASAVQFTRNPQGIRDALRRIGGGGVHGKLENPQASGVAHFFFANALSLSGGGLMSTHPALADRLKAIDGHWDGTMLTPREVRLKKGEERGGTGAGKVSAEHGFSQAGMMASIGMLSDREIQAAQRLRAGLPKEVSGIMRHPKGAMAIVLGLLLEKEPLEMRTPGYLRIEKALSGEMVDRITALIPQLSSIAEEHRLAVLELALPALKSQSTHEIEQLIELVDGLIKLDGHVSLSEMGVVTILKQRLETVEERSRANDVIYTRAETVSAAASMLVTWLAAEDRRDGEAVKKSLERAFKDSAFEGKISRRAEDEGSYAEGPAAFEQLRHCSMSLKSDFLQGCARVVTSDGNITVNEANLLRIYAVAIGCPMPPLSD